MSEKEQKLKELRSELYNLGLEEQASADLTKDGVTIPVIVYQSHWYNYQNARMVDKTYLVIDDSIEDHERLINKLRNEDE